MQVDDRSSTDDPKDASDGGLVEFFPFALMTVVMVATIITIALD